MNREVSILESWEKEYFSESDEATLTHDVILSENDKGIARITYTTSSDITEEQIINKFMNDFEHYKNLPKLSEVPKMMKEIYEVVVDPNNDSGMYFLNPDDWEEYLQTGKYTEQDLKELEQYVKNNNFEPLVEIYNPSDTVDYVICGYMDIESCLNDDRDLSVGDKVLIDDDLLMSM